MNIRFVLLCTGLLIGALGYAQETTGTLRGYVTDADGAPVEFATVKVTDVATNAVTGVTTQERGFYSVRNLTPSVYTVEVSYVGYQMAGFRDVKVALGQERNLNVTLATAGTTLDEVTVTATARADKSGNERHLSAEALERTPTLFRSVQELTGTLAENNLNSFGGASPRFNNLNIDGVATNDVIGFQEPASGAAGAQATGTPGSLARTQPIGLGAIKELSVKLSPFDVSIGNFNGANVDIITKNGTNERKQTVFGYGNNQTTLGNYVEGVRQDAVAFFDYQLGFNTGGPLKKDKLFYFVNAEYARSKTPLVNAPGSATSNISSESIDLIRNKLLEDYGYDPGIFASGDLETASRKVFARLDYLLSDRHKLTLRNNFVSSFTDNLEWNASFFNFGGQGFRHNSVANSTVLELKSNYGNLFNKLNVSYNTVDEGRTFDGELFPHLQIATSSSTRVFAGTYREASVFNTDFSTVQLTDKVSYVTGRHTLSGGLLLQLNDVDYGFLSAWNGRWEYKSVDDFLADRPSRIRGVYNVDPANNNFDYVQNNPAGTIGILESAVYAQDKFGVNANLDLSYGVRLDGQWLTQRLPVSELISSSPEFSRYTNELNHNLQVNPRLGLTYRIPNHDLTLRAGTGLFSGKLPYLWFGYIEYISGTQYFNVDSRPDGPQPIVRDLSSLAGDDPITEVNLLDPDFRYPRDWKTNAGVEWTPGGGYTFGAEFTYTRVLRGLLFQTLNRNPVFATYAGADDRVYYAATGADQKVDEAFTNVFALANSDRGFRYNLTLNAERQTKHLYSSLAYSYGLSKDVSSTVRSSPAANYEWNQALFGNDPALSFSNYDLRHRIVGIQSLRYDLGERSDLLVSVLYNGRSGSPFSFVYQGDVNRDGSSRNDLVYVPADATEIALVGTAAEQAAQYADLAAYIAGNAYLRERRGQYAERNGAKTPWNHQVNLKVEFGRRLLGSNRASLSLDVFNVLNLINKDWGDLVFVPNVVNSSVSLLKFEGVVDNVPQYSFNIPPGQRPWLVDGFNSRWRAQLGFKYEF